MEEIMLISEHIFNSWRDGPNGTRVLASEKMWKEMWKETVKWNKLAAGRCQSVCDGNQCTMKEGHKGNHNALRPTGGWGADEPHNSARHRVFCASLGDVFEDWGGPIVNSRGERMFWSENSYGERFHWISEIDTAGIEMPVTIRDLRNRLGGLIRDTQNLDYLVLTKRPENAPRMLAEMGLGEFTPNLWLGCSIATQADADRNIPLLLQCRDLASVLWVSYEPAIEAVDFTRIGSVECDLGEINSLTGEQDYGSGLSRLTSCRLDWIVCGGESGHNARPFNTQWARDTISQCKAASVPCFVKQLGSNPKDPERGSFDWENEVWSMPLKDKKGGNWSEWPEDLRVREFPEV